MCLAPVQVAPVHQQLGHSSGEPRVAGLAEQLLKGVHKLAGCNLLAGSDATVERDRVKHLGGGKPWVSAAVLAYAAG